MNSILTGVAAGLTAIALCVALYYIIKGIEKIFDYLHKKGW